MACSCGGAAAESPAQLIVDLPEPGSQAWRPLVFPRIKAHSVYDVVQVGGSQAFRARSECSASAMVLPLEAVALRKTPRLSWRWRVERGLEIEDERTQQGDDFAARVYVMFPFDPARAPIWERMRRALAQRIYGATLPGHTINYVWTSRAPPGSSWTSPYSRYAHLVALRSSASQADVGWQHESVDLLADYQRLVGEVQLPPVALAVMSDSDNSCQSATAFFADFRFSARPPPTAPPAGIAAGQQ